MKKTYRMMKRMNRWSSVARWASMAMLLMVCSLGSWAEQQPKPFVVPELTTWTGGEGWLTPSGKVVVKDAKLYDVAVALATDCEQLLGQRLTVQRGGKVAAGDIVIARASAKAKLGKEGYELNVAQTATLSAATAQGAYWGTRTLLQLFEQRTDRAQTALGALPCGKAVDVPQYPLRGFMIDCGRKFIPMAYLRNLTRVMAYYKMNTLQIHLNDNGFRQYFDGDWDKTQAAFRLESTTYPGLAAKDGFYTKQEFKDLQRLGEQLGVEIIPEIDAPAHTLAFAHYRPELGSKKYGMDHLDLSNPDIYTFLDGLFKEYLEGNDPVFRGKRVHIGTDEYSNADKEVVEQFRAFTDHYIRFVESYGKQAVVWGALTHAKGTTPVKVKNVLMDIWYNGYANPRDMKALGYQMVSIPDGWTYIVPAAGYYYDYLNCKNLYENWTPARIGNEQFEENDPQIEGGMFAVWNDHVGNGITVKDIHHRVMPALQTISTKCWTGKRTQFPYAAYDSLRKQLSEAPGVNELARHGKPGTVALTLAKVEPGAELPLEEMGYNYAISFDLTAAKEDKGTKLFTSDHATVYLADPKEGKLGFEREGYLNTFNYRPEVGKKVRLRIEGDNRATRLYVDGKLRETLDAMKLYVRADRNRANFMTGNPPTPQPVVYTEGDKIYYQRTLVFPLRHAGAFKSTVEQLEVKAL